MVGAALLGDAGDVALLAGAAAGWLPPPAAAAPIEAARISASPLAGMMTSLRRHQGLRGEVGVSKPGGCSVVGVDMGNPLFNR
jgi:hypothetical protein